MIKKVLFFYLIFCSVFVFGAGIRDSIDFHYSDIFTVSKEGAMFTSIQAALDSFVKLKNDTARIFIYGSMPYESISVDTSINVVNIKGQAAYGFITQTLGHSKIYFNKNKTNFELEYLANFSIISTKNIILYANKCTFDSVNIVSEDTSLIEFTCCEILDYFKCNSKGYIVNSVSHHAPIIGFIGEIFGGVSDSILYIYKNPNSSFVMEKERHASFFKWNSYKPSGGLYTMRFSSFDGLWTNAGLHVDRDALFNGNVKFNSNISVKKQINSKKIYTDTLYVKNIILKNKKIPIAKCDFSSIPQNTKIKIIKNNYFGQDIILGYSDDYSYGEKYSYAFELLDEFYFSDINRIFVNDNDEILNFVYKKYNEPDSVKISIGYINNDGTTDTLLFNYKLDMKKEYNSIWLDIDDLYKRNIIFYPVKINLEIKVFAPKHNGIIFEKAVIYMKNKLT